MHIIYIIFSPALLNSCVCCVAEARLDKFHNKNTWPTVPLLVLVFCHGYLVSLKPVEKCSAHVGTFDLGFVAHCCECNTLHLNVAHANGVECVEVCELLFLVVLAEGSIKSTLAWKLYWLLDYILSLYSYLHRSNPSPLCLPVWWEMTCHLGAQ